MGQFCSSIENRVREQNEHWRYHLQNQKKNAIKRNQGVFRMEKELEEILMYA